MLTTDLNLYREAVQENICRLCLDRMVGGGCSRPADDACALETHLESVVESVLSVPQGADIADYVQALREGNCTKCRQDADGNCEMRDLVACSVDSYVLRVVEVVEDVAREHGHGRWAATA
jgi:hypothetical protein